MVSLSLASSPDRIHMTYVEYTDKGSSAFTPPHVKVLPFQVSQFKWNTPHKLYCCKTEPILQNNIVFSKDLSALQHLNFQRTPN